MTTSADLRPRMLAWLVTSALFMEVLDGNIIATALPQMALSFGVDVLQLNVAMSAYLLALGVFIPVSGWVADRYGPRRVFACAVAGFTLSSLACGLVEHLAGFIALRVLQGACAALSCPWAGCWCCGRRRRSSAWRPCPIWCGRRWWRR